MDDDFEILSIRYFNQEDFVVLDQSNEQKKDKPEKLKNYLQRIQK